MLVRPNQQRAVVRDSGNSAPPVRTIFDIGAPFDDMQGRLLGVMTRVAGTSSLERATGTGPRRAAFDEQCRCVVRNEIERGKRAAVSRNPAVRQPRTGTARCHELADGIG